MPRLYVVVKPVSMILSNTELTNRSYWSKIRSAGKISCALTSRHVVRTKEWVLLGISSEFWKRLYSLSSKLVKTKE